jgi:hypothetical protein
MNRWRLARRSVGKGEARGATPSPLSQWGRFPTFVRRADFPHRATPQALPRERDRECVGRVLGIHARQKLSKLTNPSCANLALGILQLSL